MQVDISFDFAKIYNIERVDVVAGQKFKLFTDAEGLRFFSDNDPVLSLRPNGTVVEGAADDLGTTTILIMDANDVIHKKLVIRVVDAIVEPAATLNPTAGEPVLK
jgi:hypothetical protein